MKFEEIFKEAGLYKAKDFAKGFAFKVDDNGTLKTVQFEDEDDLLPFEENALCYDKLFTFDYEKVWTRGSLFK